MGSVRAHAHILTWIPIYVCTRRCRYKQVCLCAWLCA